MAKRDYYEVLGVQKNASEAERYLMGNRIRAVKQGPKGAVWLLEDGGRLLKLTPR